MMVIAIGPQNTLVESGTMPRIAAAAVSTTGRARAYRQILDLAEQLARSGIANGDIIAAMFAAGADLVVASSGTDLDRIVQNLRACVRQLDQAIDAAQQAAQSPREQH